MNKHKVIIQTILASDQKELTKMQTKLNQWITAGVLVKYQMLAAGENIVFNICKLKEKGE